MGGLVDLQRGYTGNLSSLESHKNRAVAHETFQSNSESEPGDIYHMISHIPFAN